MTLIQILSVGLLFIFLMGVLGALIGNQVMRLIDRYYPEEDI